MKIVWTFEESRSSLNIDTSANSPASHSPTPVSQGYDPLVSSDSYNWLEEYRRRLKICEQRPVKFTSLITDVYPPDEYARGEMHHNDVILAIGAVWLSLKNININFTFADLNFFSIAWSMRIINIRAINGINHFLIPLYFNGEIQPLSSKSDKDRAKPLKSVFSEFQRDEEKANEEN